MFADAQSTKGTDAEQQSVESQENSDVSKAINLPASLKTDTFLQSIHSTIPPHGTIPVFVEKQSIYSTLPSSEEIPVVAEDVVAQQSIHKDSCISKSPKHVTGTEVLEVFEALIHLSTMIEDVELTVEGMEAYEATGSHTSQISNSILNVESGDKVQQLVQNPVVIEESNDGEEANISNAIIDPEDDLFFPEDMPTHVRQQKMKELDAKKKQDYLDAI